MKLPRYELIAEKSLKVYEFISEGPKGQIPKLIKFSETALKGFYNLAFGDKDPHTGEIDDKIISNNGDSQQVLATVVAAVYAFTDANWRSLGLCHGQHKSTDKTLSNGSFKIYGRSSRELLRLRPV